MRQACRIASFLQALDPVSRGVALEALFRVRGLDKLRALLGPQAETDLKLHRLYYPVAGQLRAIRQQFDVAFDPAGCVTRLHNLEVRGGLPYLFHSGYELALLLDGTKQLGFVDHTYPPAPPRRRERVRSRRGGRRPSQGGGRRAVRVPASTDNDVIEGFRRVYYSRKGEEWRIPACKLLWSTRQLWDATCERLWSMLFGYEDWQTDYWIAYNGERGGAWSGMPVYCPVNSAPLNAVEAVGFHAFPPVQGTPLTFCQSAERPTGDEAAALMVPEAIALVHVNVRGRFLLEIMHGQPGPRYTVPEERLPEFNRSIVGIPELVAHRG